MFQGFEVEKKARFYTMAQFGILYTVSLSTSAWIIHPMKLEKNLQVRWSPTVPLGKTIDKWWIVHLLPVSLVWYKSTTPVRMPASHTLYSASLDLQGSGEIFFSSYIDSSNDGYPQKHHERVHPQWWASVLQTASIHSEVCYILGAYHGKHQNIINKSL